jgi:hypothetical protein
MNASATHTTNATDEAQFLAPETRQQAVGNGGALQVGEAEFEVVDETPFFAPAASAAAVNMRWLSAHGQAGSAVGLVAMRGTHIRGSPECEGVAIGRRHKATALAQAPDFAWHVNH